MNARITPLAVLVLLLCAAPAAAAADFTNPVFTEFVGGVTPGLSADGGPTSVALGPDGNVWMAERQGPGRIAKVTPAGVVTEFTGGVTPGLTVGQEPTNIAAGPDGNLWVTEFNTGGIVKITPGGAVTEYPRSQTQISNPTGITAGPDGQLWFTEFANPGKIMRISAAGTISTVAAGGNSNLTINSLPRGITRGPDGNVWFTGFAIPGRIGRVTPTGVVTEFTGGVTPGFSYNSQPVGITAGPDGNLWFTEQGDHGGIGRITPAGVVTEFELAPGRQPTLITSGPDGNLWFTEAGSPGGIGRITPTGVVTEFLAGATPGFTVDRMPTGITTGADGNLWFTEQGDPGAIVRISPRPGTEPTPAPTATATATAAPTATATAPGGGSAPPRVTAVVSAAPVVAGSPALLSAQVLGSAQHLDWDVTGDGKTDVSCPGAQPTLSFRPSAARARASAGFSGRVTVQAVGADGSAPALAQSFAVAPAAPAAGSQTLNNAVARVVERQPPVYTCGRAEDLGPARSELSGPASITDRFCLERTMIAGTLEVTGCLLPVHQLADIPPAERGIIQALARAVGVGSTKPSTVLTNPNRVLGQVDGFVAKGRVLVNGVELTPRGNASIVLYTQVNQIVSSDAEMSVGGIPLAHRTDFSLDTKPGNGNTIPLGNFGRLPGGISGLGDFVMNGPLGVTLLPGARAGSQITTELKLPSFMNFAGDPASARVTLRVSSTGALVLEDMHIKLPDVSIGLLELNDLQLDFFHEGRDSVWKGQGKLCITAIACVDAVERSGQTPPGGIVIRNGELDRAFVNLEFPDPGIALYPNVYLKSVGAGAGLNPTRLFGAVGVKAIGIYKIDGRLVMAFPTTAAPYRLTPGEIGGLTEQDYSHTFTQFMLAASGTAKLEISALDLSFQLGSAYFVYEAPGYVHVGGDVKETFGGIVSLEGRTNGEFNLANGRFNFGQDIKACVLEYFCRGSATRLSSVGVGACATFDVLLGSISIGGGVQFRPFRVLLSPFDGCRWSEFEDAAVFDGKAAAAAAQAGDAFAVTIKPGDRSRAIRLDGAGGAPLVRVTTPGGQVLDSPAVAGTALTPAIRILRSQKIQATIVGLQDPKPGRYQIDPLPGSPAITKVTESEDPLPARVSARVTGRGAQRTLVYDVLRRPDQRVTFVETGPTGKRVLGTVTGGRGTLKFTPAPGSGRRTIEAQFELAGIGAETKTIAAFTPPSVRLARPAHLTVRRRGGSLLVAWTRVTDAARYQVVTTLASGGQRVTRTRGTSAVISRVARSSAGRVSVRAVAPLRQGAAASARFRATARPAPTRFGPLPRP